METEKLEIDQLLKGAVCKIWPELYFKNIQRMKLYYEECDETTV